MVATPLTLRWQADRCRAADAPVAGAICDAVADHLDRPGVVAGLFPDEVRAGDQVGLRTMAVVHLLARTGRAPAVADHLPTCGASPANRPTPQLACEVVAALSTNADELAAGLARIPQTNDPGRSIPLRAVLTRVGLPVRLVELGTSAGLNLRADLLAGDPACEAGRIPTVVERLGCDLDPIDPTTTAGRDRLHSYVWVDHTERARALDHAIDVAARTPATVMTTDIADTAATLSVQPGTATVVWHSLVWGYLARPTRTRVLDALAAVGATAQPHAVLVHASWEPLGDIYDRSGLMVRVWDGSPNDGIRVLAATGDHHGRGVTLTGRWPTALNRAIR